MNKIYQIEGQLTLKDRKNIEYLCAKISTNNVVVVDIGTYKGASCALLAKTLAPNKRWTIYTVDNEHGDNSSGHPIIGNLDTAKRNIEQNISSSVLSNIHFIRADSVAFANHFDDNSLDLVFIDADHTYDQFCLDLNAWWPKVKNYGGILSGHDCDFKFKILNNDIITLLRHLVYQYPQADCPQIAWINTVVDNLHDCYTPHDCEKQGIYIHPGVLLGLYDMFGNTFVPMGPFIKKETTYNIDHYTSIWYKQKT
jgi:predicted O-methyltransferase YrrM